MAEFENPQGQGGGRNTALTQEEKNWGMYCHLAVFAGFLFPLGNVIGPLIIWLIKKDAYPFVEYNGRQAINFQITLVLALVISALLAFLLIGFVLLLAAGIYALVVTIQAIVASSRGEYYRYPHSIEFIK